MWLCFVVFICYFLPLSLRGDRCCSLVATFFLSVSFLCLLSQQARLTTRKIFCCLHFLRSLQVEDDFLALYVTSYVCGCILLFSFTTFFSCPFLATIFFAGYIFLSFSFFCLLSPQARLATPIIFCCRHFLRSLLKRCFFLTKGSY